MNSTFHIKQPIVSRKENLSLASLSPYHAGERYRHIIVRLTRRFPTITTHAQHGIEQRFRLPQDWDGIYQCAYPSMSQFALTLPAPPCLVRISFTAASVDASTHTLWLLYPVYETCIRPADSTPP